MTVDAQRVIADVLLKHRVAYKGPNGMVRCQCSRSPHYLTLQQHYDHQAAAVAAALGGLTRETLLLNEYAAANGAEPERQSRWVGGWIPKEAE